MVRMPPPTPPDIVSKILDMRAAGVRTNEIAAALGITVQTVYNHLNKAGAPVRAMSKPTPVDPARRASAVARYRGGESAGDIAAAFGVAPQTVRSWVLMAGETTRSKKEAASSRHLLSDADEKRLVEKYLTGIGAEATGAAFGVSGAYVYKVLIRLGVPRFPKSEAQRKRALRDDAFDTPTPDAMYWAGFMMADGSVRYCDEENRSPSFGLHLAECDRAAVSDFRDWLGSDHALQEITNKEGFKSVRVEIRSRQIVDALGRYGVVPGKQGRESAPEMCRLNPHFWRGVLDGDGCYCVVNATRPNNGIYRTPVVNLCGGEALLHQFVKFLAVNGIATKAKVAPHRGTFTFSVGHLKAMALVKAVLAESGGKPTLARKLEKMRAMMAEFAPVEASLPEDVDEVIDPDSLPRDPKIED